MSFLWRVTRFNLRNRLRSLVMMEPRVELLLLHLKRSQLRWFGHLVRTFQCPLDGHPKEDSRLDRKIISLDWLGPRCLLDKTTAGGWGEGPLVISTQASAWSQMKQNMQMRGTKELLQLYPRQYPSECGGLVAFTTQWGIYTCLVSLSFFLLQFVVSSVITFLNFFIGLAMMSTAGSFIIGNVSHRAVKQRSPTTGPGPVPVRRSFCTGPQRMNNRD